MSAGVSADPADRIGVFKSLCDVPTRYRLYLHRDAYAGRNVWNEYLSEYIRKEYTSVSDRFYRRAEHAGELWIDHMYEQDRHHALARPMDVVSWVESLLETRTNRTVYLQYWVRLEEFFTWLQSHCAHPHTYHPALMAVSDSEAVGDVWHEKIAGNLISEV